MRAIRVVLAEDNTLLREGLSRLIEGDDDLDDLPASKGSRFSPFSVAPIARTFTAGGGYIARVIDFRDDNKHTNVNTGYSSEHNAG